MSKVITVELCLDFELLKQQSLTLEKLIRRTKSTTTREHLRGLQGVIDSIVWQNNDQEQKGGN